MHTVASQFNFKKFYSITIYTLSMLQYKIRVLKTWFPDGQDARFFHRLGKVCGIKRDFGGDNSVFLNLS